MMTIQVSDTFFHDLEKEKKEIYNQALEDLFDKTLNIVSSNYNYPYLGDAIYGIVNDAMVDAIKKTKEQIE